MAPVRISEMEALPKGTLMVGDGVGAPATLPAAADKQVLVPESSATPGVAWDDSPTFSGDIICEGKQDIGKPGVGGGLDIGEGGSYSADAAGVTIVSAFTYDASAASGSRFTELALNAQNTLLGDAGDRIYVGSPNKHWALRFEIGVAKSSEVLLASYWDGSSLRAVTLMGVLKDSVTTLGDAVLEQTVEQEYITFDRTVDDNWATADDQLDVIPNTGTALFWMVLEVPGGGLATPPRIDEIKVRGTDADFATASSQLILWGKARVELHEVVGTFSERAAAQPKLVDIAWSVNSVLPLFQLRNGQSDGVDLVFKLPKGIDTSSMLIVTFDWFADATGEVDFDLVCKVSTQGTAIGVGEADTGLISTSITPSGADELQSEDSLTGTSPIDISMLNVDDLIIFTLIRRGAADTNAGNVYPILLSVHHIQWTLGEQI